MADARLEKHTGALAQAGFDEPHVQPFTQSLMAGTDEQFKECGLKAPEIKRLRRALTDPEPIRDGTQSMTNDINGPGPAAPQQQQPAAAAALAVLAGQQQLLASSAGVPVLQPASSTGTTGGGDGGSDSFEGTSNLAGAKRYYYRNEDGRSNQAAPAVGKADPRHLHVDNGEWWACAEAEGYGARNALRNWDAEYEAEIIGRINTRYNLQGPGATTLEKQLPRSTGPDSMGGESGEERGGGGPGLSTALVGNAFKTRSVVQVDAKLPERTDLMLETNFCGLCCCLGGGLSLYLKLPNCLGFTMDVACCLGLCRCSGKFAQKLTLCELTQFWSCLDFSKALDCQQMACFTLCGGQFQLTCLLLLQIASECQFGCMKTILQVGIQVCCLDWRFAIPCGSSAPMHCLCLGYGYRPYAEEGDD
eukprot:SAG22_NODE_3044_length_1995_cov_1.241034_1_plen_418_part_01